MLTNTKEFKVDNTSTSKTSANYLPLSGLSSSFLCSAKLSLFPSWTTVIPTTLKYLVSLAQKLEYTSFYLIVSVLSLWSSLDTWSKSSKKEAMFS